MKPKKKSVFLRNRRYIYVGGSLLPRTIRVSLDATGDSRWLRLGLVPGMGRFTNTRRFFSFGTVLWVKAPESRTGSVVIRNLGGSRDVEESLYKSKAEEENTVVRWGLLSTANINKAVISPLRRSTINRLCAVASRDGERASQYAKAYRIPRSFGSYEEMLASDTIDAVYISLPNHLHAEWAIKAMEAGKHVLCEKPLALTVSEVDSIRNVSEKTGCVVAEAFMYRHHQRTKEVKRLLDGGVIGDVQAIKGAFTYPIKSQDDVRLTKEYGGGCLWDVGCYPVSFARYLMGEEPVAVSGGQRLGPSGVDLHFCGQMVFKNGAVAQIEAGFDAPLQMSLTIVGSDGILELPNAYKPDYTSSILLRKDETETDQRLIEGGGLYRGELEDLAEAVLYDNKPLISIDHSKENVRVLQALYLSADTGKTVSPRDIVE